MHCINYTSFEAVKFVCCVSLLSLLPKKGDLLCILHAQDCNSDASGPSPAEGRGREGVT